MQRMRQVFRFHVAYAAVVRHAGVLCVIHSNYITRVVARTRDSNFPNFVQWARFNYGRVPVHLAMVIREHFRAITFPFASVTATSINLVGVVARYIRLPTVLPIIYVVRVRVITSELVNRVTRVPSGN